MVTCVEHLTLSPKQIIVSNETKDLIRNLRKGFVSGPGHKDF